MPRIKFEVTGKVTGVFFRVETVKKATSLGVTGWIRNTPQHSVQGEAQHKEQSQLDKFTHWIGYEGPPGARIDQCKVEKTPEKEGETEFKKVKNWDRTVY